jgi:hypothetical protein
MKRIMLALVVALFFLVSCSRRIDEEMVIKAISAWWGVDGVDGVVVESFTRSPESMVFSARLVVSGDTLERMTYDFYRGIKGWELRRGPFTERQKQFLLEEVGLVNIGSFQSQRELAEVFKGVMDVYGSHTGGRYPLLLSTKLEDIPEYHGEKGEETILSMIRPFLEGELPFVDARGDTGEWFSEYRGKVVYFPLQEEEGYALQYAVKPGMDTCFVDDILRRWRELEDNE